MLGMQSPVHIFLYSLIIVSRYKLNYLRIAVYQTGDLRSFASGKVPNSSGASDPICSLGMGMVPLQVFIVGLGDENANQPASC